MAEQLKVEGGPSVTVVPTTNAAKTATLTFAKQEEIDAYDVLLKGAEDKDYSLSKYLVRLLLGKETNPLSVSK